MTDALLATAAAVALVAVGLAVLGAVSLAPFVAAVNIAERRGLDVARWGLVAAGCVAGGLVAALVAWRAGRPLWLVALAAASTWVGPLLTRRVRPGRLAGTRGQHS